ncbi:hypothetical protein PB1_15179 [Bacillus methanolicus PB1]|uniref:YqzL family protein n=1 Tax=Bacillus methanolicus PB1 TaxID=997296 RepID=I3DXE1_BACMT|nr:YqzL family protein [Bacillus methanolicus]EIJ78912.1 hypothetical protein PB1_15179 [Bacillus methanolicus PB1]
MLEFTWKIFLQTGDIDTYLLFKELEKERQETPVSIEDERTEVDFPIS